MATLTAQILVGAAHPYDGGINPTHFLFLSENDRPAWILLPQNIFYDGEGKVHESITWIPTVENMLEDALLMIAIHALKEVEIIELAENCFRNKEKDRAYLYDDINQEDLKKLHARCRSIERQCKIVVTVLDGSTIHRQLKVLENY